ncbi:MAG: ABC transporter permease [Bauldia sp.]
MTIASQAMTITAPPVPRGTIERIRWAIKDGWTITRRDFIHIVRKPEQIIGGLLFPILSVVLFGYVFGSAIMVPGGGDYREFLMPGLFVMAMVFGIASTAIAVVTDNQRGVIDRFRSMPMARSGVVLGRSVSDMFQAVIDLTALFVTGFVVGWGFNAGFGNALLAIALLLWLRFAMIWLGIFLGLWFRTAETAGMATALVFPIAMIANTFVAPELMPGWLGFLAEWNPLSSTVAATRELFGNPGVSSGSWIADNALLMAILWPTALIAIFAPLSVRRYKRLSR